MNERLRVVNHRVRELQDEQRWREIGLRRNLSEEDYEKVKRISEQHAENVFERTKEKQRAKFEGLMQRSKNRECCRTEDRKKWVTNLSDFKLTEEQESVLQKGLNFAKTPNVIPRHEIIANVECSLRECEANPDRIEHVRASIASVMKNAKPPRPNTTSIERTALRSLKENKTITILPADKGNRTVVMNTTDYEKKASDIIEHEPFRKLTRDPTARNEKRVNDKMKQLLKEKRINESLARRLRVPEKSTRPPLFYGSVKVHKMDNPLRPIVSTIGSATYKVSKYVGQILRPYVRQADSYINNTQDFLGVLQETDIDHDEIMVSFDIKSLFTSVPTIEAKTAIYTMLKEDNSLKERSGLMVDVVAELLDLCLSIRNFQFREKHYELTDGLAMGAPASPAIANIYMASLERKALDTWTGQKPKAWCRFVDDVFTIVKRAEVNDLLKHLNDQHPSIKFTLETESDDKLPFMDVTVHRIGKHLRTTVYRKPTHSGRYLNFSSHHPPSAKRSVVQSLHQRIAYVTTSETDRQDEKGRIESELQQNGYTEEFIRNVTKMARKRKNTPAAEEETTKGITATIPYIEGLSEQIRRILAQVGIRTSMTVKTVKWIMMGDAKDRVPAVDQAGVVYAIGCKTCPEVYVGETARTARQRAKEHRMHARTGNIHLSATAAHAETGHEIHWEPRVLAKETHTIKRKVIEAMYIRKLDKRTINQDSGMQLSKIWLDLA